MCGIIGAVSSTEEVAPFLYLGLWSLHHRGKETGGITTSTERNCYVKKGMGTVDVVFAGGALSKLKGKSGIGHVRYSTAGKSNIKNGQPIRGSFRGSPFWIAHNGNLPCYRRLKRRLRRCGYKFRTNSDTEIIVALISLSTAEKFEDALLEAVAKFQGTYALVVLHKGKVYGLRDKFGSWPLKIGQGREMTVFASETCTFDVLKIKTIRSVSPGELVVIDPAVSNWYSITRGKKANEEKPCIFQSVYFARPDSIMYGERVTSVREHMGELLWKEWPVEADVVVPVPDSGNCAADGLVRASNILLVKAFFRSHFVGRTFMVPVPTVRVSQQNIKLNIMSEFVAGKIVVLVDDSIIRATVMRRVIGMLREAQVREIHVRISSPMYLFPCYYGIDTYRLEGELIARRNNGNIEAIRREIGADSLRFLSLESLRKAAAGRSNTDFCDACFTGKYHIPVTELVHLSKH